MKKKTFAIIIISHSILGFIFELISFSQEFFIEHFMVIVTLLVLALINLIGLWLVSSLKKILGYFGYIMILLASLFISMMIISGTEGQNFYYWLFSRMEFLALVVIWIFVVIKFKKSQNNKILQS